MTKETCIKPLDVDFFDRDTVAVAQALLGQHLLRWDPDQKVDAVYRIVETEAYTQEDPACHAFRGNRGRGATLFKAPGLAYVYLIYGMYHCLNVVTESQGRAGAVLFRALEPVSPVDPTINTKGPGRLCKALGITRAEHNELPMTCRNHQLYLAEGPGLQPWQITTAPRIGISQAKELPWRFYETDSSWVSVRAKRR